MDEIRKQVAVARRRLILQQYLQSASWCLSIAFAIALLGIALPRLFVLPIQRDLWTAAWLGGALVVGLLAAVAVTWWRTRSALDAALELDRRFGLKERVSSALSLSPHERETTVGQALVDDAIRRVSSLEVHERFQVALRRSQLWFVLPALLAFALATFVPIRSRDAVNAARTPEQTQAQVKKSTEALKKRIEQQRKQAEEKGLADAEVMFQKLSAGLEDLRTQDGVDRKKALIKLNDLAKEIEERRQQLGAPEKMRERLQQLKQMQPGPADKMMNALKEGDLGKAMDQVKTLSEQLKNNEMSDGERQKLVEQLKAMQEAMKSMAEEHEQAKQDLERQIQQKMAEGDTAAAGKLQRQLDAMQSQDQQMKALEQLAQKMGEAAESVKNGEGQEASAKLDELASELESMKSELQEMESLDSVLDQISQSKDTMNCPNCNGMGCSQCEGMGMNQFGMGRMRRGGMGMGEGQGQGDRPEQETDSNFYDSQVRGKPKGGEAVLSGQASGPNKAGVSKEDIKQQIQTAISAESDPLTDQRLPRTQRDHAKAYFELLRKGE